MKLIKDIEIAYFRSFYKVHIKNSGDLNVIFGKNDAGKSNIVRALNLFFNNETDYGRELDFDLDFADSRKSEARESDDIRKFLYVKITFNTPKNYQKSLGRDFYVKRQWTVSRGKEYVQESSNHIRSNQKHIVTKFINLIKFIYIPAIKDESIFQNLLRDVYFCVANKAEFSEAIDRFTTDVRAGTDGLFSELDDALGSSTSISAPSRLEELFETLDFETQRKGSNYTKSLTLQRGDGVKVRHIPEILKFISKNDGYNYHIWGFEEPENSLDFSSATSESLRFKEISESADVQIFLTTHNPSFYNVSGRDGVSRIYVRSDQGEGAQVLQGRTLDRETDESLMDDGFFLPAVAKRLAEVQKEYELLQQEVQEVRAERHELSEKIKASQRPILVVEGKTDHLIFRKMFTKIESNLPFDIFEAGGTGNLEIFRKKREILSSMFVGKKILILVDADEAGIKALPQTFGVAEDFKADPSGYFWRTIPLSPSHEKLRTAVDHHCPFFGVEDLFGVDLLHAAKLAGKLKSRENYRHGLKTNSKAFHNFVSSNPKDEVQLLEIDDACKVELAEWLTEADYSAHVTTIFKGLYQDIQRVVGQS